MARRVRAMALVVFGACDDGGDGAPGEDAGDDPGYCGARELAEPPPCDLDAGDAGPCRYAWCRVSEACPTVWGIAFCAAEECLCVVAVEYAEEMAPCIGGDGQHRYDTVCCVDAGQCCEDVGDTDEDGSETDWVGACE